MEFLRQGEHERSSCPPIPSGPVHRLSIAAAGPYSASAGRGAKTSLLANKVAGEINQSYRLKVSSGWACGAGAARHGLVFFPSMSSANSEARIPGTLVAQAATSPHGKPS